MVFWSASKDRDGCIIHVDTDKISVDLDTVRLLACSFSYFVPRRCCLQTLLYFFFVVRTTGFSRQIAAYLEQEMGFTNVTRLEGGIVSYSKFAKERGLESKFKVH